MSKFDLDSFLEEEETKSEQLSLFDTRALYAVRRQNPPRTSKAPGTKTRRPGARKPLNTIDLGAGAGLLSFAFFLEGFRITEACELDPQALASLDENFNHTLQAFKPYNFPGRQIPGVTAPKVKVAIRDVDPPDRSPSGPGSLFGTLKDWEGWGRKVVGAISPNQACDANRWVPHVPEDGIDVFIGGPPCQPYSGMGHGKGKWDQRDLFPQIPRIVAHCHPRVVVMENVGLALSPRHRPWFDAWWKLMDEVGYEGTTWKLRAADYGSPQLRERAWFIAWPKGAPWGKHLKRPPPPTHAHPAKAKELGLAPWVSGFQRLHQGCCMGYGLYSCLNLNNLFGECASPDVLAKRKAELPSAYFGGGICRFGSNYVPDETGGNLGVSWEKLTKGMQSFVYNSKTLLKMKPLDFAGLVMEPDVNSVGHKGSGWLAPAPCHRSFASKVGAGLSVMTGARTGPRKRAWTKKEVAGLRLTELSFFKKLMDLPVWYSLESPKAVHNYGQLGNGVPVNLGRAVARHVWQSLGRKVLPEPSQAGLWPIVSSPYGGGCNPSFSLVEKEYEWGAGYGVEEVYAQTTPGEGTVSFGPVENIYWFMPDGWQFETQVLDPVFSGQPANKTMVQFTRGKDRYRLTGMSFDDEMKWTGPVTFEGKDLGGLRINNSPLQIHWLIKERKKGNTWTKEWRRPLPTLEHALMEFAYLERI